MNMPFSSSDIFQIRPKGRDRSPSQLERIHAVRIIELPEKFFEKQINKLIDGVRYGHSTAHHSNQYSTAHTAHHSTAQHTTV